MSTEIQYDDLQHNAAQIDAAVTAVQSLAPVASSGAYDDLTGKPVIDTAISTTSTNAVQNNAVSAALSVKADSADLTAEAGARAAADAALQTAVDGKASVSDIYGVGTAIAPNSDLDDLTAAGVYYSDSAATSASLSNCPHTASIFHMFVYLPYGVNIHQILYPVSSGGNGYYYKRMKTTSGWTAWARFTSYGLGQSIAQNTDLDTVTVPGIYQCNTNALAQSFAHCPCTVMFQMEVKCTTGSTRYLQEITTAPTTGEITLYKRVCTVNGWQAWHKFEGTVVS